MKTTLHYLSLNAQAAWHRQVDEQLEHLHRMTAITAAEVVLEHQQEAKPASGTGKEQAATARCFQPVDAYSDASPGLRA